MSGFGNDRFKCAEPVKGSNEEERLKKWVDHSKRNCKFCIHPTCSMAGENNIPCNLFKSDSAIKETEQ